MDKLSQTATSVLQDSPVKFTDQGHTSTSGQFLCFIPIITAKEKRKNTIPQKTSWRHKNELLTK